MAKQTINIGTTANDGTGDPIRAAFGKVNDNFTEIYTANTGVNTGDQNLSAYATTAAVAAGYQPLDSDLTAISALTTTAYGRALLSTADAATLRSAIGVGTTDAPTFLAQTLTGQSLTGTQATSLVDLSATWNTSGTPTAIKLNVVETGINSNAASNLMDLQVGGVSKFKVEKTGSLNIANGSFLLRDNISGCNEIRFLNNGLVIRAVNEALVLKMNVGGMWAHTDKYIGFGNASGTLPDTALFQDAPGILAQRNGTAKQALRVYNTALSGAPEWAEFDWITSGGTNTLRIGTNLSGTGAARPIDFVTGGVVRMSIAAAGNVSIAGTFNFGSSNGALPGGTNYGGNLGTSQDFAIRGTSTTATNIYIQNGSSGNKQGWVRVLGSGSVDHGALEVGAIGSSPVIFTTALTEKMRLSAAGNFGIGTASPTSKLQVSDGDIEVDTIAKGVILKSPDGTRYRVTVPNGGAVLTITAV